MYKEKYLKYKQKYLQLKNQIGGGIENKNILLNLFNNVKIYGKYINLNKNDGLENWNKIKNFLGKDKLKNEIKTLNNILGDEWNINIKINKKNTTDLNKIYDYVHDNLKMYGDDGDMKKYSINKETWSKYHFFLQLIRIPKNNKLELLRLLQIAYNLGQFSVSLDNNDVLFNEEIIDYFNNNNLNNIESYVKLNENINDFENKDLLSIINKFVEDENELLKEGYNDNNIFYSEDVEKLTNVNNNYRNVLYTGKNQQFVLMSIDPLDDIHMEVHEDRDQFIRIEKGDGIAIINDKEYKLKDNTGLIIPAGASHQIKNTSKKENLKLYTIYSPPEHTSKLVQQKNPNK